MHPHHKTRSKKIGSKDQEHRSSKVYKEIKVLRTRVNARISPPSPRRHVRNRVRASHFFCAHACSAFPIASLFFCHGFCKLPAHHTLHLSAIAPQRSATGAACDPYAKSKKPRQKKKPQGVLNIISLI